jgi:hypothetical protein
MNMMVVSISELPRAKQPSARDGGGGTPSGLSSPAASTGLLRFAALGTAAPVAAILTPAASIWQLQTCCRHLQDTTDASCYADALLHGCCCMAAHLP